jgi:hypothetical protein
MNGTYNIVFPLCLHFMFPLQRPRKWTFDVRNISYRQVLERGVAQKLPARKMKSLFAKFLQFEEHHGTREGVEKVRQMAINYVEATAGRVEDDD